MMLLGADDVGKARRMDREHDHHRRRLHRRIGNLEADLDLHDQTFSACRFVADRDDVDADLHADEGVGRAEIGAVQRDRLARIARHRHTDEVAGADDAVGRIELDPARARQIDLHPGMRRAAADIAMRAVAGNEEIAGDETRGDAEPPQRLDHEQRIVAAGAGPGLQRIERMLGALLVALAIGEGFADAMGHAAENVEGRRRPVGVEEIPAPRTTTRHWDRHIAA